MISSLKFETEIGQEYKRNNRSTRQKSLRCFPTCGVKGHVTGGFCGLPLKVRVQICKENDATDFNFEDYRFIAEIRPVNQPRISGRTTIPEAELITQIRNKFEKKDQDQKCEIFQAEKEGIRVLSTGPIIELELSFNVSHCSWDYAWKSNRWSGPQEQHVVDIIVLKSFNLIETRIVSFRSSSPFVVSSSHKKPVKTNVIKEEDDEEVMIALPLASRGQRRSRPGESLQPMPHSEDHPTSQLAVTTHDFMIKNVRGYMPPTHTLRLSADGSGLDCIALPARQEDDDDAAQGALALIQLSTVSAAVPSFHAAGATTATTTLAAQGALGAASVPPPRKVKKVADSSHKRVKKEHVHGGSAAVASAAQLQHHMAAYSLGGPSGHHHPGQMYGLMPMPIPIPMHSSARGSSVSSSFGMPPSFYPMQVGLPYMPYGYPGYPPPGSYYGAQNQDDNSSEYEDSENNEDDYGEEDHAVRFTAPVVVSRPKAPGASEVTVVTASSTRSTNSNSHANPSSSVSSGSSNTSTVLADSNAVIVSTDGVTCLPVAVPVHQLTASVAVPLKKRPRVNGANGSHGGPSLVWDGTIHEALPVQGLAPLEPWCASYNTNVSASTSGSGGSSSGSSGGGSGSASEPA